MGLFSRDGRLHCYEPIKALDHDMEPDGILVYPFTEFYIFALATFPIIWYTPVVRTSFALTQDTKVAVCLPKKPVPMGKYAKKHRQIRKKTRRKTIRMV